MEQSEQPALCRLHRLRVVRVDKKGVWLDAGEMEAHLPLREAPNAAPGDELEVFVYQVVPEELQATLRPTLAQAGQFALLKVKSITAHGAYLDWGLAKDLLVPLSLQPQKMQLNWSYLVKVDVDQQGRPFGNGRIEECLEYGAVDLQEGDPVDLMIWQLTELGARVIVNGRYEALLYRDELPAGSYTGMELDGFIKRVREDGKIDVTLRRTGQDGVVDAKEVLLKVLAANGGALPLHDKSSPDEVKKVLGMSKKTFKKAVGGLYKDGSVILDDNGIRLK